MEITQRHLERNRVDSSSQWPLVSCVVPIARERALAPSQSRAKSNRSSREPLMITYEQLLPAQLHAVDAIEVAHFAVAEGMSTVIVQRHGD